MVHNITVDLAYGIHPIYGKHVNMDPMVITLLLKLHLFKHLLHIFCPKSMPSICPTCIPCILVNQLYFLSLRSWF